METIQKDRYIFINWWFSWIRFYLFNEKPFKIHVVGGKNEWRSLTRLSLWTLFIHVSHLFTFCSITFVLNIKNNCETFWCNITTLFRTLGNVIRSWEELNAITSNSFVARLNIRTYVRINGVMVVGNEMICRIVVVGLGQNIKKHDVLGS